MAWGSVGARSKRVETPAGGLEGPSGQFWFWRRVVEQAGGTRLLVWPHRRPKLPAAPPSPRICLSASLLASGSSCHCGRLGQERGFLGQQRGSL